jgi:GNAT superfamily N-acetyltransferase
MEGANVHMVVQEPSLELEFLPLTQERWQDFEDLLGKHGAFGGCWCMWWRLKRAEFERQQGEANRQAMKAIVESGEVPGLLAYDQGRAIGWCSIAPRRQFPVLQRSPVLKPVDDTPVWSVVCFFVEKAYRNHGISTRLLQAAMDYARQQGGAILEGYPIEPRKDEIPSFLAFTGPVSIFHKAGFVEVARRSPTRPIMRYVLR